MILQQFSAANACQTVSTASKYCIFNTTMSANQQKYRFLCVYDTDECSQCIYFALCTASISPSVFLCLNVYCVASGTIINNK